MYSETLIRMLAMKNMTEKSKGKEQKKDIEKNTQKQTTEWWVACSVGWLGCVGWLGGSTFRFYKS